MYLAYPVERPSIHRWLTTIVIPSVQVGKRALRVSTAAEVGIVDDWTLLLTRVPAGGATVMKLMEYNGHHVFKMLQMVYIGVSSLPCVCECVR